MSIRKMIFLSLCLFVSACSSDTFLVHNGNMPSDDKVAEIKEGQSKQTIVNILGAPSLVTGLSEDHWIYMASTTRKIAFLKPTELERKVLAITFENDSVSKIEKLSLEDGNKIAIDGSVTDTAERNQGFFRKYFGGVGTYMPFGSSSEKDL